MLRIMSISTRIYLSCSSKGREQPKPKRRRLLTDALHAQAVGCDLDIVDEICFRFFEFSHPVLHPLGDEFIGFHWLYLNAVSDGLETVGIVNSRVTSLKLG